MSINLEIDGKMVTAREGMTLLEVARENDIDIPTLCYDEVLEPLGVCRLCVVEVKKKERIRIVASCAYPAEANISVRTRSERVDRIRRVLLEFVLEETSQAPEIQKLARTYGAKKRPIKVTHDYCIVCGKCVAYCAEVKGKHLVGFKGRGEEREVVFPEAALVPPQACIDCGECYYLCPTKVFPIVRNI